ncbi:MAG TPA: RecBCD nuclease inhibitor [Candidatus Paceibacterota bacterium]
MSYLYETEDGYVVDKATYDQLVEDQDFLEALEAAGVDNWEGYSTAIQIVEGELDPEDI